MDEKKQKRVASAEKLSFYCDFSVIGRIPAIRTVRRRVNPQAGNYATPVWIGVHRHMHPLTAVIILIRHRFVF